MIGPAGFMSGPKAEPELPVLVTLLPHTAKHKQKVRRHGNVWRLVEYRNFVICLNGPGMLVCPCDEAPVHEHPQAFWMPLKYVSMEHVSSYGTTPTKELP